MIEPKLEVGFAHLKHDGRWCDAVTDELARETARFLGWDRGASGVVNRPLVRTRKSAAAARRNIEKPVPTRARNDEWQWPEMMLAVYEDANGRRWRQVVFARRGIMAGMDVKVEVQGSQILITNRDGSFRLAVTATAPLLGRLNGKPTRFFRADVGGGVVELGETIEVSNPW